MVKENIVSDARDCSAALQGLCNNPSSPRYPDYSDLCSGSFHDALASTSRAKARYTPDSLYPRGSQLLATSYTLGVTSMRAFVELDHVMRTLPLTTAIRLKTDFAHLLELQICAFAQDPIYSTTHGNENRAIIEHALAQFAGSIGALGTTPYVETSRPASLSNIEWAITRALKHRLHLDFHLDYTLESPSSLPSQKTTQMGAGCQLQDDRARAFTGQRYHHQQASYSLHRLANEDIFMMGRPTYDSKSSHNRPRGTIHVPSMITEFGLSACLGVNNVGNAFTPYGTGDPLQLASWAVGIYQVGTAKEAELLYECVSNGARQAIGLDGGALCGSIHAGDRLSGMLLLKSQQAMELPGALGQSSMVVAPRRRLSLQDVVWDPPENKLRFIVR
ncbi:hypothetical protein F4803DRAFT_566879 [Xylaria telfairii]|nr:hypothetical protein F4803DRAFT_566879 [Xylaria telfairii]